jgi:hypothetical protein
LPQLQVPFEQPSAAIGSHEVHAFPLLPQVATDGVSHVLPLQQPVVQVCEQPWHAWFTHVLVPHGAHAAPPPPHWVLLVPS